MSWTRSDLFNALKEYGLLVLVIGVGSIFISVKPILFLYTGVLLLGFGLCFGSAERHYQIISKGEL